MSWLAAQYAGAQQWIGNHQALGVWLVVASAILSIGGLLAVRHLVLIIPEDYFVNPRQPGGPDRHPAVRLLLVIGKNVLGAILLVLGLLMLVAPGPGVVTLLLAVVLLDIPGKRWLERRIIALPSVLHVINRMRRRAHRPELVAPRDHPV